MLGRGQVTGTPRRRSRPKKGPISRRGHARRVRTEELFAIGETGPTETSSNPSKTSRELEVAGLPVALVSGERNRLSPLRWTSAVDMPPVDMLAGIASQNPTGLLALESADGLWGAAFDIVGGRIVAAMSTNESGHVERWSATFHHLHPERFQADEDRPLWLCLAQAFIEITFLEGLRCSAEVGTQLTFLRGEFQWLGSGLEPQDALKLDFLLMEHARQRDEFVVLERQLPPPAAVVLPLSKPPADAPPVVVERHDGPWADLRTPDALSIEQWRDACATWSSCDGETTVAQMLETALLGRFRTLRALVALRAAGFVRIELKAEPREASTSSATVIPLKPRSSPPPAEAPPAEEFEHVDAAVLASLGRHPDVARHMIEDFMGAFPDWLADLDESIGARSDAHSLDVLRQLEVAATSLGARFVASLATLCGTLIRDDNHRIATELIRDLEDEYAAVFRTLVAAHASLE